MKWNILETEEGLRNIINASLTKPQVIFKHSTRCGVSSMAKSRLDSSPDSDAIDFHYLDLIKHRPISNLIAETFSVHHESPQVLLIKNGDCIYDDSHSGIRYADLVEQAGV